MLKQNTFARSARTSARHTAYSKIIVVQGVVPHSVAQQVQAGVASPAALGAIQRPRMGPIAQATSQTAGPQADRKTSVLFVCLGNICRSPTAEAMFRSVVEKAGVADKFDIDSCGTGGGSSNWYLPGGFSYHEGDASDPRMTAAAIKRGVQLTSRSRPLVAADLNRFDYIIGMDPSNIRAILRAAGYWAENDKQLPDLEQVRAKTSLMTKYCTKHQAADEVPDPYYGGPAGFERVLDLLDDAATGLLGHIEEQQQAAVAVAETR